ncbi:MAG: 8-oxo-dGTP diphosphatase MutT [Gammaproteobacteria bacterium]|nr:8-oxo-dGTP diphosphatase MutT [Gammaproteobacteria bacterium]
MDTSKLMPITAPDNRLYVVVGVIQRENDKFLIQQRPPGKDCAGQWEFPGGKLELGETPGEALVRELHEELGVTITHYTPLTQLGFDYPHAQVWLDVFLVTAFEGQVSGVEGQAMRWLGVSEMRKLDLLEAVYPILDQLRSDAITDGY